MSYFVKVTRMGHTTTLIPITRPVSTTSGVNATEMARRALCINSLHFSIQIIMTDKVGPLTPVLMVVVGRRVVEVLVSRNKD